MRAADPERRFLRARRRDLRNRGIRVPRIRRVMGVTLEGMAVPEWALRRRVRGLSASEHMVWLSRRDAYRLEHEADELGAHAVTMETEYRRCGVCGRPLVGEDAAARRQAEEMGVTARQLPCGSECLEAARDRRWKVKAQ